MTQVKTCQNYVKDAISSFHNTIAKITVSSGPFTKATCKGGEVGGTTQITHSQVPVPYCSWSAILVLVRTQACLKHTPSLKKEFGFKAQGERIVRSMGQQVVG